LTPLLSADRILMQSARNRKPWEELKEQIYLGSEAFIETHAAGKKPLKARRRNGEPPSPRCSGNRNDREGRDR